MDDLKIRSASEPEEWSDLEAHGITEEEAKQLKKLLLAFHAAYKEKSTDMPLKEWLAAQYKIHLPEMSREAAEELGEETVTSIEEYDKNLAEIKEAATKGKSKEQWFADKVQEASAGMAVAEYGKKLYAIDEAIQIANEQMYQVITRKDGAVSQNRNLDGFIAEQTHVNRFNMQAALEGSPYQAEVCVPDGAYGKNSFDVIIKDTRTGARVHQYQMKYGANAEATIQLIKKGNYNNQILVVPPEQVAKVQAAFPGKTVIGHIGGTGKVEIPSDAISKEAVKKLQEEVQKGNIIPEENWNSYNTRELAVNLGKNAALAGMQGALIGTGFHLATRLFSGEEIDEDETIQVALETGADASVKSVAAGAMTAAQRKGFLKIIPDGTPASVIANVACVAVENIKIAGKVAEGELTVAEGLDQAGQTTVSMAYGLSWITGAAATGATALSWIPVVGPALGGMVGGMVGYMAGSTFGQMIYTGAKKIISTGVNIAKSVGRTVMDAGRRVLNGIADTLSSFLPW